GDVSWPGPRTSPRRPSMLLALLPALALAQAPTITIRAGTVLDGRGGILHNTTIVIAGSRIARLDPALTAATYDLSRLTVMPGRRRRCRWAAAHRPTARRGGGGRDQDPRLEEHPRRRRADALRGRAAGRVWRSQGARAALRRPCACGGGRAARRAGRGDVDRARRTAR